ncbi:helix-turn-helix domain-containing protein [uncultured Thiohalocapsa sp.]|uniref:helix-turn-helix domain-containing protein n=1 Tax=uncultured Thiohalocapsa sp. TaxID=768990 RepID=UPI0025E156FD|nr:helix-turn-helix domain-containing protein [uncultured Thiohalocapsa sp.]
MTAHNVVHLPTPDEMEEAKASSRTLAKYADADRVHMTLRGSNGESDELVLPGHVLQMLLTVLSEMSQGNAISLIPRHQELSTQEAASLLNVSRPFVVGLLEKGEIPYHKVGSHRRVRLEDVLAYKESVDRQRLEALDRLTDLSQQDDMGY